MNLRKFFQVDWIPFKVFGRTYAQIFQFWERFLPFNYLTNILAIYELNVFKAIFWTFCCKEVSKWFVIIFPCIVHFEMAVLCMKEYLLKCFCLAEWIIVISEGCWTYIVIYVCKKCGVLCTNGAVNSVYTFIRKFIFYI